MIIIDVREKEEFEAEHIPDSICCPMSQFDLLIPGILRNLKGDEVTLMCRTGNRSRIALNELKKIDTGNMRFSSYEGGILKWKSEGNSVRGKGSVFPIMRQVQIVASSMIFLAFLAAHFLSPQMIYLALFVGFGLALSGYTGFCPMVFILQRMPWNNKKISNCDQASKSCCG
ncbi:MAG: rhodanese-like domain-containing protein [Bacteriovoracaceae bacterium]